MREPTVYPLFFICKYGMSVCDRLFSHAFLIRIITQLLQYQTYSSSLVTLKNSTVLYH